VKRIHVSSGAKWEPIVGYSRLVRVGPFVFVTGTTATLPAGGHVRGGALAQARQALANVVRALATAGLKPRDVVRTRLFVTDIARDWRAVGRAHAEVFGAVRPATTMVEVSRLIEPWMRVEIEADAIAGSGRVETRTLSRP
jgi:enamine deaminase RidA (YjgF/YER057c/UK114 family)